MRLPLAYRAAPSGSSDERCRGQGGVIGLIRFLPFGTPLVCWGMALAAGGLISALYASALA
jgi:hypothetical protein